MNKLDNVNIYYFDGVNKIYKVNPHNSEVNPYWVVETKHLYHREHPTIHNLNDVAWDCPEKVPTKIKQKFLKCIKGEQKCL